jgi:hypothetical protein
MDELTGLRKSSSGVGGGGGTATLTAESGVQKINQNDGRTTGGLALVGDSAGRGAVGNGARGKCHRDACIRTSGAKESDRLLLALIQQREIVFCQTLA